jgi:Na+/proline symporter
MTSTEVSNGLILPYFAITIAGTGGAAAITLITFMAVTSTLSAQVIAVSSIISFDIYRTYINRTATDRDVIKWSHYGVVFFAIFAAAFSTMLHYVGVDLGWTLYMLGKSDPTQMYTGFLIIVSQVFLLALASFRLSLQYYGEGRTRSQLSCLHSLGWRLV